MFWYVWSAVMTLLLGVGAIAFAVKMVYDAIKDGPRPWGSGLMGWDWRIMGFFLALLIELVAIAALMISVSLIMHVV